MRYHRTPEDKRTTYRQYDEDGRIIAEFNPEKDTTMDVTIDVKRRITKLMHYVDDAEVKQNNKERRLDPETKKRYEEDKELFIKKFREEHGRDPQKEELPEGGHRSFVYLDAPVDAAGGATLGDITPDETITFYKEEQTPASYMDDLIQTDLFTDRERTVYDCKIRKKMTDEQTGKEIGRTKQLVGMIWKGMKEKILNDPGMRNFYRL